MKYLLFICAIFFFINASSQIRDSLSKADIDKLNNIFGKVEGKKLPVFTARDLNGKTYTISYRGKATFLNFWFANCPPCISEIPELNRLYKIFKDSAGFQFYSITFESEESAKKIVTTYGITYPVLLVSVDTAKILNFGRGYPTNMILDGEGKICFILTGGMNNVDAYLKPELQKLLNGERK